MAAACAESVLREPLETHFARSRRGVALPPIFAADTLPHTVLTTRAMRYLPPLVVVLPILSGCATYRLSVPVNDESPQEGFALREPVCSPSAMRGPTE